MSARGQPLRWGILSAGSIASDFVTAMKQLPDTEHKAVAVAARSQERAEEFGRKFNIPRAYGDYTALAEDPDVDVIYVSTINPHHYATVKLVLSRDKHVLCEKPFMMNMRQTEEVLRLAKKKRLFCMEACWSRFFPAYHKLRSVLEAGEIGNILLTQVNFCAPASRLARITEKDLGGGGLLDLGVYCAHLLTLVMGGAPLTTKAVGATFPTGVDKSCSATLLYSGDRIGQFNVETQTKGPITAVILGTKGKIELEEPFYCPTAIRVNDERFEFPLPSDGGYVFYNSAGLMYEIQAVGGAIAKGELEHPLMTHKETSIIAGILEDCRDQVGVKFDCD